MISAVIDTNVLVAGFLSPHGPPGRIVEWLRAGSIRAVIDDRIISEYREVLTRPRFGLPAEEVALVLNAIIGHGFQIEASPRTTMTAKLPDPDDAAFLECAQEAQAWLVTGNARHYPKRLRQDVVVLTPAEFVERMELDGGCADR